MRTVIILCLLICTLSVVFSSPQKPKANNNLRATFVEKRSHKIQQQKQRLQQQHQLETQTDPNDVVLARLSLAIYDGCPENSVCIDPVGAIRLAIKIETECFVIFRGTQNVHNWLTDLDAFLVDNVYGPGKVHQGFQNVMKSVAEKAAYTTALQECVDANKFVYFAGHSLGGAVATLAAQHFRKAHPGHNNFHFATFGSPRVGNYHFQQGFIAAGNCGGKGNRYESVKSDTTSWFGFSHSSPPGDEAKPGDIVPRVPPITPIAQKIGAFLADLVLPTFWLSGNGIGRFLGIGDDDDDSREKGFRHVGQRYQVTCDNMNLLACHSTHVYVNALESTDSNAVRRC